MTRSAGFRYVPFALVLMLPTAIGQEEATPPAARSANGASRVPEKAEDRVRAATGLRFAVTESKIRRRIISTDSPFGFKVKGVDDDSPADDAGIESGWLLMKWSGQPIRQLDEIDRWLWALPEGARVELAWSRHKKDVSIFSRDPWESGTATLTIERTHPLEATAGIDVFVERGAGEARTKEDESARAETGVTVHDVVAASPASRGGLRAGDRIVAWGEATVSELADLREPFLESLDEERVVLRVSRMAEVDGEARRVERLIELVWEKAQPVDEAERDEPR